MTQLKEENNIFNHSNIYNKNIDTPKSVYFTKNFR